jgi:hypothetical protein
VIRQQILPQKPFRGICTSLGRPPPRCIDECEIQFLLIQFTKLAYTLLLCQVGFKDLRIRKIPRYHYDDKSNQNACTLASAPITDAITQALEGEYLFQRHELKFDSVWHGLSQNFPLSGQSSKEDTFDPNLNVLVVSRGGYTFALRLLLEEKHFASDGEIFAVYPGCLSYENVLRSAGVSPKMANISRWRHQIRIFSQSISKTNMDYGTWNSLPAIGSMQPANSGHRFPHHSRRKCFPIILKVEGIFR